MSGIELTDRGLVVDRDPNRLDELAIDFCGVRRNPFQRAARIMDASARR